ncbi:MAG: D-2-hydroxyacid dehydrogenase [Oscillospiraceae bacterium]|nr:D-2-hydroxyacid dehydrogenase [Oscillospiraceae bacterium]
MTKHKLAVLFPVNAPQREALENAAQTQCALAFAPPDVDAQTRRAALLDADAAFGEPTWEELAMMPQLRWIQMSWSGVDYYYNRRALFPPQITLTNATGVYGATIAEHIFSVVLALFRGLPTYFAQQKAGIWRDAGRQKTLEGKTVLILGAGDIGTALARRLRPFACRVLGVRRAALPLPDCYDGTYGLAQLDALLPQADVVVCCLPNTPQTQHLLGRQQLLAMKRDAVLVNVGRGNLIVTDELISVMQGGHLYGAALDVTDPEPLPPENPLWQMPNVILTPHAAGVGSGHLVETEDKIVALACRNLRRYLAGEPLENIVNLLDGYRAAHD